MRVTNAPASRERRRRRLELAKGFYGARSKLFRTATEAVDRAMRLSTEHQRGDPRRGDQLLEVHGGSHQGRRHVEPQEPQRDRHP